MRVSKGASSENAPDASTASTNPGQLSGSPEPEGQESILYSCLTDADSPKEIVSILQRQIVAWLRSFLMGDHISTNGKKDKSDTYVIMDIDAIDSEEQFHMSKKKNLPTVFLYSWSFFFFVLA